MVVFSQSSTSKYISVRVVGAAKLFVSSAFGSKIFAWAVPASSVGCSEGIATGLVLRYQLVSYKLCLVSIENVGEHIVFWLILFNFH